MGRGEGEKVRGGAVGAALTVALAVSQVGCDRASTADETPGDPIAVERIGPFHPPVRTEVWPGDTIESVCRRLAGEDWPRWRDALVHELDPRRLRPGTAFEGTCTPSGELEELRVLLDRRSELKLGLEGSTIRAQKVERQVSSEVRRLAGEVASTLWDAVEESGGRPELAVRLAEIFQWDIDFFRDLRKGDRFVAVIDQQSIDGSFYRYGTLFAARFVNAGRVLDAVVYPDENGRLGYYDLEGRPLRKQFLRSPLKFSRITSRFSMSRYHPVLKRRMPHYGVDYGARVGTPVHATADGVISFTGPKQGAGRMVRVRHPNGFETHYLHLSRYAKGIRQGVRVVQGQVLGYVGSSGWSTGPHLDYRIKQNGRWVNPLTITSPPAKHLHERQLQRFLSHALAVLELLEGRTPPTGARC
jgi:murein DD-endopeptidase MepM/ murein hydrolase activator NlpD